MSRDSRNWKSPMPKLNFVSNKSVWKRGASWAVLALLILLISATFISYADVLVGPVRIYSSNPPIHMITQKSGQYGLVNATQNQQVSKGEVLAVLKTNAVFEHVMVLKDALGKDDISISSFESLDSLYPHNLSLGLELQKRYSLFLKGYMKFVKTIQSDFYLINYQNDSLKHSKSKQLLATLKIKALTQKHRLEIATRNLLRSKTLLDKGVISQLDYSKEQEYVNAIKIMQQQVRSELDAAGIANVDLSKSATDASDKIMYDLPMQKRLLQMQRRELLETIKDWEFTNTITSPMDGTISLIKSMNIDQYVNLEEHILTVSPLHYGGIIAECKLPIWNSGRLKKGMKVYVNLENFPSREWGRLKGDVVSFSETPLMDGAKMLSVKVCFNDMVSTYGKTIKFKQEMSGNAEIILEDVNLIQRIGYSFKDIWDN